MGPLFYVCDGPGGRADRRDELFGPFGGGVFQRGGFLCAVLEGLVEQVVKRVLVKRAGRLVGTVQVYAPSGGADFGELPVAAPRGQGALEAGDDVGGVVGLF